jgi:hypothetical protein
LHGFAVKLVILLVRLLYELTAVEHTQLVNTLTSLGLHPSSAVLHCFNAELLLQC